MATLTITVTAGQAARIKAALRSEAQGDDLELTDAALFDKWLRSALKTTVLNYERRVAINAVNDSLATEL